MSERDDLADDARVTAARISILTTLSIPMWPQHRAGHMELCGDCRIGGEPCNLVLAMDRCIALVQEVRELRKQKMAAEVALARLLSCTHGDEDRCGCRQPANDYFNNLPSAPEAP